MFSVGSKVMHPLHGLGTVESIEHEVILAQDCDLACISFQNDRLKIKVNLSKKNAMIRPLVDKEEILKIVSHLKTTDNTLPIRSSDRYNFNLRKVKSCDVYQLAEVIRDLTVFSKNHKLPPKEQQMLKQARKTLAIEFGFITNRDEEDIESEIDEICRNEDDSVIS